MKTLNEPNDMTAQSDLDALFAQAQAQSLPVDPAFMARALADAQALQPRVLRRAPVSARGGARRGFWARLAATLGGAIAVAGLGSAAMAGLVIGYVQPEPMISLAGSIGFGMGESLDLLPGFDALLTEDFSQ